MESDWTMCSNLLRFLFRNTERPGDNMVRNVETESTVGVENSAVATLNVNDDTVRRVIVLGENETVSVARLGGPDMLVKREQGYVGSDMSGRFTDDSIFGHMKGKKLDVPASSVHKVSWSEVCQYFREHQDKIDLASSYSPTAFGDEGGMHFALVHVDMSRNFTADLGAMNISDAASMFDKLADGLNKMMSKMEDDQLIVVMNARVQLAEAERKLASIQNLQTETQDTNTSVKNKLRGRKLSL